MTETNPSGSKLTTERAENSVLETDAVAYARSLHVKFAFTIDIVSPVLSWAEKRALCSVNLKSFLGPSNLEPHA
jgi:hypothetical protein